MNSSQDIDELESLKVGSINEGFPTFRKQPEPPLTTVSSPETPLAKKSDGGP